MKNITCILAAILATAGLSSYGAQLTGDLGFSGTVNLDTDSSGTATTVTGWHQLGNLSTPYVSIADGDFLGVLNANATSFSSWPFNSGALPTMWSVGGFTFDLAASSITVQIPPTSSLNGVWQDGAVAVSGTGTISGNGFDPTLAVWTFTTQDPSTANASGPRSFSFSASLQCQPDTPALQLIKTASPTNATPGQAVTYSYAVTNIGTVTITNINIVDDNGTTDTSDDFYVNAAPFSLAPGQGTSFAINHVTEPMCMTVGGTNLTTGTLTVNVLANGNVEVFYNQSQALNDNRYGTNATAATGWSGGHKFGDLTGSDGATFLFTDGNGNQVLEFQEDYISSATSAKFGDGTTITYPSGYGTLGPLGGDGKMLIGASSNVLSCRTTLSDTLNQSNTFYGFTVNSPPETSPLSNVSIPAGWNYTDGYYVLISSNAFGAAGFGSVTIPYVHNSPAKTKPDLSTPTNVCDCVVNTAGAIAYQGTTLIASAFDDATVCFGTSSGDSSTCNIVAGKVTFGPGGVTEPLKNSGSSDIFMSELDLSWPAVNGRLKEVDLNGKVWTGLLTSPVTLTSSNFIAAGTKILKGKTKNLVLKFEHPVSNDKSLYTGTVKFGTDTSCIINFLP